MTASGTVVTLVSMAMALTLYALMGVAMAGMAWPSLNVLPARAWEGVFALQVLWSASGAARLAHAAGPSHCATHTAMAAGMLYMYLDGAAAPMGRRPLATHAAMAMPGGLSDAGTSSPSTTLLSLLFVLVLVVSVACELDCLRSLALAPRARRRPAPRLQTAAHLAMCGAMAFMLVAMG